MRYDADIVASIFYPYGDREWDRHELQPHSRVRFEIHRWEIEACRSEGALDAGTHMLFCVERG